MRTRIVREFIEIRQSTESEMKFMGFATVMKYFKEDQFFCLSWSKTLPPTKIITIRGKKVDITFSEIVLDEFFPGFTEWCVLTTISEEEWETERYQDDEEEEIKDWL